MSKHDLQARPIYHHKRESIDAHLAVVFAALAVSHLIESPPAGRSRNSSAPPRRYRTVQIHAGSHILTAEDPLPDDLRESTRPRSTPKVRTNLAQVGYEDPERSAALADSVSMAALLLLERLSPLERAVFVLREVFGFSFPEIASAVGRSEAACRQLAVRARRHMDAGRPRFEADRRERDELASRFFDALRDGDVDGVRELLAADVQMVGDGGGKAPALPRSVIGAENVARVLASIFPLLAKIDARVEQREVNGQPGAILRDRDDKVVGTLTLDLLEGQIQTIRAVANPDKLGHVGPVADAWAIAREVKQARRPTD